LDSKRRFQANQTYYQKPLRAAHKAPLRTGAAGARGLEVARGGRRLGRLALLAKPLPAPHRRAAKRGPFRWQSKAGSVATAPGFDLKGSALSATGRVEVGKTCEGQVVVGAGMGKARAHQLCV
jgi:hypothetical protein